MRKSYYRQLPLAPLGAEALRELARATSSARSRSTRGLAELRARTGGNPFFTEEIVHTLIETGQPRGDTRRLSS